MISPVRGSIFISTRRPSRSRPSTFHAPSSNSILRIEMTPLPTAMSCAASAVTPPPPGTNMTFCAATGGDNASKANSVAGITVRMMVLPQSSFNASRRRWFRCSRQLSSGFPAPRGKLEALEFETRGDRAADQRPVAEAFGRLPGTGRNNGLWPFAGGEIGSERYALNRRSLANRDRERKRRACVVVPDLGRVDPMPVRTLAARQQKIDRGRGGAGACDCVAEGFAEMPPFRVRLEREQADHVGSGKGLHGGSKGAPKGGSKSASRGCGKRNRLL